MSYCTIEEAWGLSESFSNDTTKAKRRKHKKKHARKEPIKHHHMHEKNTSDTNQEEDGLYEPFVNSPSVHYQPLPTQQEAAFTRSFEPERIPDAIDVSVNGSTPYQGYVEAEQVSAAPAMNHYEQASQETLSSEQQHRIISNTTPSSQSQQASVHEELEWMRNNMSHLTDKIERLTDSLEAKQQQTQHTESATQAYDTLVFVFVGMFVLVLVDICFRAGQRFKY